MKNKIVRLILIIPGVLLFNYSLGQGGRKFTGRLVLLDGNQKNVSNLAVRLVDEGSGVTGTDGKFEIAIRENTGEVTLELVNTDLSIIYPTGGKALVPADQERSVEFIVGDSPKSILTKAVAKSNNELKDRL